VIRNVLPLQEEKGRGYRKFQKEEKKSIWGRKKKNNVRTEARKLIMKKKEKK